MSVLETFDAQTLAALVFTSRPMSEVQDINEAAQWVGLPAFEAPPDDYKLTLIFDSAEAR